MIGTNGKITDATIYSGYRLLVDGQWIYVAPNARRNFVFYSAAHVSGDPEFIHEFYLSAEDNDILADGVTITEDGGCDADLTIGRAISKEVQATFWDGGKLLSDALAQFTTTNKRRLDAFDGVVVDEEPFTVPEGATCYLEHNDFVYYGTENGAYVEGQLIPATEGYSITAIEVKDYDDAPVIFAGDVVFDFPFLSTVTRPTVEELLEGYAVTGYPDKSFMVNKYIRRPQSIRRVDSEFFATTGKDATMDWYTWDCETGIKTHWVYVKLTGIRLDNITVNGDTIQVHGYDQMTLLDTDCTEWVQGLDWSSPRELSWIVNQTIRHAAAILGATIRPWYVVTPGLLNTGTVYATNPFLGGQWTYRQILSKCAEWCGGIFTLSYWQYNGSTPYPTIFTLKGYSDTVSTDAYYDPDSDTIVTKDVSVCDIQCVDRSIQRAQYDTPAIGRAVAYTADGTQLSAGTSGEIYYITGNPMIHAPESGADYMAQLLTALQRVSTYKAWRAHVIYSDPRIEVGDLIVSYDNDLNAYQQPIMSVVYHWAGTSDTEYASIGQATRDVPIGDDYVTKDALEERLETISGEFPAASDASPLMDGTADAGTDDDYSRADHVHPTDTSRAPVANPTFTGEIDVAKASTGESGTYSGRSIHHTYGTGYRTTVLNLFSLYHNSTSGAETTYTMQIPSGTYLILHSRHGAATAAATGAQLASVGSSSGAVIITLPGSGSQVGATSGSRSEVSITNNSGDATLTWTVKGLSYRKLLLVRLS